MIHARPHTVTVVEVVVVQVTVTSVGVPGVVSVVPTGAPHVGGLWAYYLDYSRK
jgi:hypothetical protein